MKKLGLTLAIFIASGFLHPAFSAESKFTAVATGAAADFSSGSHLTVAGSSPRTLTQDLLPSGSDMTGVSKGKYFYRMERSGANNITKFNISEPGKAIWQYSTEGAETGSNPHDLVFLTDNLAYLIRYGSSRIWLVDTTATKQENFKIGEIDLSAYADEDGKPEINSGVIIGNRLFVTIQRINFSGGWGNFVYNQSYVAVFNASTGSEINTGKGEYGLKGIALPMENPGSIQYLKETGMLYVQCSGQYNKKYTGGITVIDPENFESAVLIDDGSESSHPYGAVTGMVVVSPTKGYFVGYNGWGNNNLFRFNPSSFTAAPVAVSGFGGKNISALEPTSLDRNGYVWLATSDLDPATYNLSNPSIRVIDSSSDQVDESISTKLVVQKIIFCDGVQGGGDSSDDSSGGSCFISSIDGIKSPISWLVTAFVMILLAISASVFSWISKDSE